MHVAEIEGQLREFVLTSFLTDTPAEEFHNGDDLFQLLDSLQLLRMVMQLEVLFGIKVADHELAAENLGSIAKVAAFVVRKRDLARQPS
jgi:acyl carrier protein